MVNVGDAQMRKVLPPKNFNRATLNVKKLVYITLHHMGMP